MAEDTWIKDETRHAVVDVGGPVGSDRSGSSDGFKPSPKLRARIEKLAKWRIDPADISLRNGSEYHGGHAAVSRGTLTIKLLTPGGRITSNIAVKKMRVADDTDFERILGLTIREAEFLAELDHKNIAELEGFVEDLSKGTIWLVFPWAEYGNLRDFIAREKWDIPERISLISDVTKGVEYLHAQNPPICHGDLKSLNVLIYTEKDPHARGKIYARITDFGSARRLPQRGRNTRTEKMVTQLPSAQSLSAQFCASTETITLTGNQYTLRWAAPELLFEDQLSLWSDIWALGWIAYEVMTGSLPFEDAASDIAVLKRVIERKLPSLKDNAHLLLIHELCSLMNMCWEFKPTQRPTADFCRRSIERMPMFAPEMKDNRRVVRYTHLRQLGEMYQSRGEYATAFTFFVDALVKATQQVDDNESIRILRSLAQLARLRQEYSKTIAYYDVIWEIYERNRAKDRDGLAGALSDLAELYSLKNKSKKAWEPHYENRDIQDQRRIALSLWTIAEHHDRRGNHDHAIQLYAKALEINPDFGLATTHRRQSEYQKAIQLYSDESQIRDEDSLYLFVEATQRQSEYEKAIQLSEESQMRREGFLCRRAEADPRRSKLQPKFVLSQIRYADALWGLAVAHRRQGEYGKAISYYWSVWGIYRVLGDGKGMADAILDIFEADPRLSEHNASQPYSEVPRMRHADPRWRRVAAHRRRWKDHKTIQLYSEVSQIRRADTLRLWGFAKAHRRRGEYEQAISLYSKVSEICTNLGDRKGRADALWGLADVHRRRSAFKTAIPLYSEVLDIRTDDREARASALWGLADVHRCRGEYQKAIPLYSEVLRICTNLNGRASALWGLAYVHRCRREYPEAIWLYSEVLEICTDLDDKEGRAIALWGLVDAYRQRSEYQEAIGLQSEVLEIRTDLDNRKARAAALWCFAEVHRLRREYEEAIPFYHMALGVWTADRSVGSPACLRFPPFPCIYSNILASVF